MLVSDDLNFFGLPRLDCDAKQAQTVSGVLFGVVSSLGTPNRGSENGPYFLRRLSQQYVWQYKDPDVIDLRSPHSGFEHFFDLGNHHPSGSLQELCADIERSVEGLPKGAVPIMVGGDHSVTSPVVTALRAKRANPFKVIVFDHHLDMQLWDGARDHLYHTNVMTHVSNIIGKGNLVHIGCSPFQTIPGSNRDKIIAHLQETGSQIAACSEEIRSMEYISRTIGTDGDVYISIDVDVLNAAEMSSTGYPADIGISLEQLIALIHLVGRTNRIIGCDLVEFAADRGARDHTAMADGGRAVRILLELMSVVAHQQAMGSNTATPSTSNLATTLEC